MPAGDLASVAPCTCRTLLAARASRVLEDQTGDARQVHLQHSALAFPRCACAGGAVPSGTPGRVPRLRAESMPFAEYLAKVHRREKARALPVEDYLPTVHRRHKPAVVHVARHQLACPLNFTREAALQDAPLQASRRPPAPAIARPRRIESASCTPCRQPGRTRLPQPPPAEKGNSPWQKIVHGVPCSSPVNAGLRRFASPCYRAKSAAAFPANAAIFKRTTKLQRSTERW